jgi:hypothetical protein
MKSPSPDRSVRVHTARAGSTHYEQGTDPVTSKVRPSPHDRGPASLMSVTPSAYGVW